MVCIVILEGRYAHTTLYHSVSRGLTDHLLFC